jgi:hypothetical protein
MTSPDQESLRALFGKRLVGNDSDEDYIDWAGACLQEGRDSKSLRKLSELASRRPLITKEVSFYFLRAIEELGMEIPDEAQAINAYARELVDGILDGDGDLRSSVYLLSVLYTLTDYADPKLAAWIDLNEDFGWLDADDRYISREGVNRANIEDKVKKEAELYRKLEALEIPADFVSYCFCDNCDYLGKAKEVRKRSFFTGEVSIEDRCPRCGSTEMTFANTYRGRKRLLKMARR